MRLSLQRKAAEGEREFERVRESSRESSREFERVRERERGREEEEEEEERRRNKKKHGQQWRYVREHLPTLGEVDQLLPFAGERRVTVAIVDVGEIAENHADVGYARRSGRCQ
jgi:hypothetical protein